jgi:hypothetical protein
MRAVSSAGSPEPFAVDVLEHDAAPPRRVGLGMARHLDRVGVTEHGPEARFAGHVLPVDRIGPPQLGEAAMDVVGEEPVRVPELDRSRYHAGHAVPPGVTTPDS